MTADSAAASENGRNNDISASFPPSNSKRTAEPRHLPRMTQEGFRTILVEASPRRPALSNNKLHSVCGGAGEAERLVSNREEGCSRSCMHPSGAEGVATAGTTAAADIGESKSGPASWLLSCLRPPLVTNSMSPCARSCCCAGGDKDDEEDVSISVGAVIYNPGCLFPTLSPLARRPPKNAVVSTCNLVKAVASGVDAESFPPADVGGGSARGAGFPTISIPKNEVTGPGEMIAHSAKLSVVSEAGCVSGGRFLDSIVLVMSENIFFQEN